MAKYTTQIRSVVESGYPLFDFSYPIFDEAYRSVLEQKIIDRYYFREIGFETVGQFKHFLKMKLNEIMPYYNEHYLALKIFKTYDPYVNKNIKVEEKRTNEQVTTSSSSSESKGVGKGETIFSDTPQARIQNKDYATNLTETDTTDTSTGKATGNGTAKTTDEYIQLISGFDGMKYASEVYQGVKETIANFDVQILDELNELFMNVY